MAGHFESVDGGGAAIALDEVEVSILRSLAVQLLELIGPGAEPAGGAAPEGMEGFEGLEDVAWPFADGPSEPPADPALARLFPDAYGPGPDAGEAKPDELEEARAASSEFRRYTENDLRARKREDGLAMVRALDGLTPGDRGAVLTLTADDSRQWLGALNDLRLAIGTRLDVSDEDGGEMYTLPDSDPRKPMVMAYLWLGGLQETLVETLMD
ncbi:DUF2017 domain-containing protein [Streptomyces sp. NPDC048172]|uniref:DUF2017 domain-containing protein n=1 Tax=Streptomyces sp. NPDC048172 TaxID=3365505 RepID=UPI00372087B7